MQTFLVEMTRHNIAKHFLEGMGSFLKSRLKDGLVGGSMKQLSEGKLSRKEGHRNQREGGSTNRFHLLLYLA